MPSSRKTIRDLLDAVEDGPPPAYQRCPACGQVIATLRDWHNHRRNCFDKQIATALSVPDVILDQSEKNEARDRQRRIEEALA
jgi:hypothetical protein